MPTRCRNNFGMTLAHSLSATNFKGFKYAPKRVSFGSKDCTKEPKPGRAHLPGQTKHPGTKHPMPDKTSRDKTSHAIFCHPGQNIPHRFATPDKTSHAVFVTPDKTSHAIFAAPDKTSHATSATPDKTSHTLFKAYESA